MAHFFVVLDICICNYNHMVFCKVARYLAFLMIMCNAADRGKITEKVSEVRQDFVISTPVLGLCGVPNQRG